MRPAVSHAPAIAAPVEPPGVGRSSGFARFGRLHTRLGLALGALVLGVALVLAFVLWRAAEARTVELGAENLENLTVQVARELGDGMDQFGREVLDQAARDRFASPAATAATMRPALDRFKANHPQFAYVSVVDVASGKVLAASGGVFEGGSAAGRPTLERGKQGLFLGDVHGAVRLAELLPKPPGGEALRFLDVAAPIVDASGRVVRVFATHIAWEWTRGVSERIAGPLQNRRGVELYILDSQSKVVFSSSNGVPVGSELARLVRQVGGAATPLTWGDGRPYMTAVMTVAPVGHFDGFGWRVVARQPYAAVIGPSLRLLQLFLLGALALGLLAAAVAWVVAGRIVRPVRLLAEAAVRVGSGQTWEALGADDPTRPPGTTKPPLHALGLLPEHAARSFFGEPVDEVSQVELAIRRLIDDARHQTRVAEAKRDEFELLAASLPQIVWQADAAGRLEYLNHDTMRPDAPAGAASVRDFEHFIVPDDRAAFVDAWERSLATGANLRLRCRLALHDAPAPRWFDLQAQAIAGEDGRPWQWIGTLFDVDDMVSSAERLESHLGRERAAREDAERSSRMRDEFLATVSHELRSPLSAITGWSDILARRSAGDETVARAATVIRRSARLQAALIDDLLDMSAVIAGKLTLTPTAVDFAAIVGEVATSSLHEAQAKGVTLVCEDAEPVMVDADPKRIAQVVANLVGNAIKFTEAGGLIRVRTCTEGRLARLTVADNGRGISGDFLPHVFDRLRQEDSSRTRKAGGLGLGLAIAKAVVELHDGRIHAASAGPGQGTVLEVELPLASGHAASRGQPSDERQVPDDLDGLRVLLVDDEPDAREVAHLALCSLGASVTPSASAAEALRLVQRGEFDVLVSDIGMPETDGLDLIRAVRRLAPSQGGAVPAIALTAFAMPSERAAGLAAGFHGYVTKPLALGTLRDALVAVRRAA